jgi:hypothetical protein
MSIKTVIAGKEIVENPLKEISQRLSVISTTRKSTIFFNLPYKYKP